MEHLPIYIHFVFAFTALLTGFFLYKASHYSPQTLWVLLAFLGIQSLLAIFHFYEVFDTFPPRFPLLVLPAFLLILFLFFTSKGKIFIDNLDIKTLTLLHIIRIPVEVVLFWLFTYKCVPQLMTFEGRNWDIISGISAPIVYYLFFIKKWISPKMLYFWNGISLILLVNIVINAILSTPTFVQQFAFEQPNIAVFYFPFHLLPAFVVPIVLFSHLVVMRQFIIGKIK